MKQLSVLGGIGAVLLVAACGGKATDLTPNEVAKDTDELRGATLRSNRPLTDNAGLFATYSTFGSIDLTNEFFQSLGTNGRSCGSCHKAQDAWTITPETVQEIFDETHGTDPIFRTNDGSNSPNADVSTEGARRQAYSMLLNRAVIRVGIGIPSNAEFELAAVDDPYGFSSAKELSLFRRPLPATNLRFLSTVMWDGRETFAGQSIDFDLSDQANGATLGHAQAAELLTAAQRESIVKFETAIFTAQTLGDDAGPLDFQRAQGGPQNLSNQPFYIGINDLFGDSRTGAPFNPVVFTLFAPWENASDPYRAQVARGEKLFNTKPIAIRGVSGINDEAAFGFPEVVNGSCTTCHNTPNSGNHSVSAPLNIGLTDPIRRTSDMPLYTLRNKTTGDTVQTTDPGRALITGKWAHIGRFKGPVLRGLTARAPYFHNGFAKDLDAVVDFYEDRFAIGFTAQEREDLIAFLRAL